MIIAFTGHRPHKLGGYGLEVLVKLSVLAADYLTQYPGCGVVSGMALGWDTAAAIAAHLLSRELTCAVPFVGQESQWPKESQERYHAILQRATRVEVVCPGPYAAWKLQRRNEWMVDRCDRVCALWDGSAGGTDNCLAYARRSGKPIDNVWSRWE